jgi:hypothetical protein
MNRLPTTSQRVVKPGVKKRRPPLACIQCYQRKLKCGRELPSCSRCSKAGNADECTYRGSPSAVEGLFDSRSGVPRDTTFASVPVSFTETFDRQLSSFDQKVDMTHMEGQGNSTKFYGYSYPLNLYQRVYSHSIHPRGNISLSSNSLPSSDHTSLKSRPSILPSISFAMRFTLHLTTNNGVVHHCLMLGLRIL